MRSDDVSHVPPPDPAAFWEFAVGEELLLAEANRASITLACTRIKRGRARFRLNFPRHDIEDWLHMEDWLYMDIPRIVLRRLNDEPAVTLTLRKIENGRAFLQVSAHPALGRVKRA